MDYEDRVSIETPEGVALELTLAGLGSRFVAFLIDTAIGGAITLALFVLVVLIAGNTVDNSDTAGLFIVAIVVLLIFVSNFGYHVLFETLASGRSPGKRLAGLRVVSESGAPIGFVTSCIRNILRIVDGLPGPYLVAIIAVLVSSRNQRLGDMAAGTLVVRERRAGIEIPTVPIAAAPFETNWDLTGLTADDVAMMRRFLTRRANLTDAARARLATDLATRMAVKVVGPPADIEPETLIEVLVAAKAARS